jgi:hypothetical protein
MTISMRDALGMYRWIGLLVSQTCQSAQARSAQVKSGNFNPVQSICACAEVVETKKDNTAVHG